MSEAGRPHEARTPVLALRGLVAGYGGRAVTRPVTLELRQGQFWALLGRNGSGKSTLLRSVLGLQPAIAGSTHLPTGVRVGYVPQRSALQEDTPARVVDVIRDGAETGWSFLRPFRRGVRGCVDDALTACRCEELAARQFSTLSEGQKQRVLVARALAGHPAVLVLDEPSSAMDRVAERELHALLRDLTDARGLAVLLVNHHLDVAAEYVDHMLMLDGPAGEPVAGTVGDVMASALFAARYGAGAEV